MRFRLFAALVLLALPSACRRAPTEARNGQVLVEWQGTHRGRFIAPMSVTHCPESGIVELIAVRGDTGVGFALYPVDSARVVTGEYRVFPSGTVVPPRPAAGAALRWYTGVDLAPFEGTTGAVHASVADSLLSGDFEVRMEQPSGTDTLTVTGRFVALPIQRMAPGCSQTSRRNLS
jgi:hypothetical protein